MSEEKKIQVELKPEDKSLLQSVIKAADAIGKLGAEAAQKPAENEQNSAGAGDKGKMEGQGLSDKHSHDTFPFLGHPSPSDLLDCPDCQKAVDFKAVSQEIRRRQLQKARENPEEYVECEGCGEILGKEILDEKDKGCPSCGHKTVKRFKR